MIVDDSALALFAVASLLLIWAGVMKVVLPGPARDLMQALGLPARVPIVRLLGSGEAVTGVLALALGGPPAAAAVGTFYMVFAAAIWRGIAKGSPSCGCFGGMSAPPSWIHLTGNLFLATMSLAAAASTGSPADLLATTTAHHPLTAVSLVLTVGVLAGLFVVSFTALPELLRRMP